MNFKSYKINKYIIKDIFYLSIPIIITSMSDILLNLIDKAIVGRTSLDSISGVGIASSFIYLITGAFGTLSLGASILFSKAFKYKDDKKINDIFNTVMLLTILLGIIFEIICIIFGRFFLEVFYGARDEVLSISYEYLKVSGITFLLNMIIFNFSAYFKNIRKTKYSMYIITIGIGINIFFDYCLTFGKFGFTKLGAIGTAYGSVIGLTISLILFYTVLIRCTSIVIKINLNKSIVKELINLYTPLLFQDLLENTILNILIIALVTKLGEFQVSTYILIDTINSFISLPIFSYCGICLTLTSQEKNIKRKSQIILASIICSYITIIFIYIIIAIFNNQILLFMTNQDKLIEYAKNYIFIGISIQITYAPYQIFKYVLQGMNNEKFVLITSILTVIFFILTRYLLNLNLKNIYIYLGGIYVFNAIIYMIKFLRCKEE